MWVTGVEGWSIYFQTLSGYYMIAVMATAIALFLSFFYTSHARKELSNEIEDERNQIDDEDGEREPGFVQDSENLRIKMTQAIANQLSASMTTEQLEKEKEIETMQLEAIYNLLQKQQEKFQVSNMQELQEQLNLYR